jgi:DNA-binding CsgD family transcriptional regulator
MKLTLLDYINQAPGLCLIKDTSSKLMACSPKLTKLLGFRTPDDLYGKTDFDLRCDASKGAKQFIIQDKQAFENGINHAVDIYRYSESGIMAIYHEKKAIFDTKNGVCGLSFSGTELFKSHTLTHQLFNLLDVDKFFLKKTKECCYSYTIKDSYPYSSLGKNESLCLFYIMRGKSNREIGKLLNLSHRTIEGKVSNIKEKLECQSRAELIEKSITNGYLHIIVKDLVGTKGVSINLN